jgi:hypothetical protein
MAKMIPPEISDSAPPSEKIIFENLKRASQARDWIVFHSEYADNPKNPTKPREIDFLILIPDYCTVICLETKGGSFEIRHKQWYRLPSGEPVDPSPPEQARSAMFALEKEFKTTHFRSDTLLSLRCAVAFTDGEFPPNVRKPKQALIIERSDTQDPDILAKKLADYAIKSVDKQLDKDPGKWLEAMEALDNLTLELDPEEIVKVEPPPYHEPQRIVRHDLETLRPQLLRLTNDQLNSLKRVRLNDRCVIDGAAGTGKTVLAMELARQRCEDGERVALLCSNPNLSRRFERWTETLPADNGGKVVAGTPATLPLGVFRENSALLNKHRQRLDKWPELEESLKLGYLDNDWHPFISETVKDLEQTGLFDYLIVDEAQNLCDEVFLKLMDALLKGGLTSGRWTMFGDFTYQNIVSPRLTENGKEVLKNFGFNWSNDMLETNCRNTHEISEAVVKLVDIESPPMSGVHGPYVQIEYFTSPEELGNLLDNLVANLKDQYFLSRQIILLSSSSGEEFNTKRDYGGWKLLNIRDETLPPLTSKEGVLVYDNPSPDNTLRYSDVYDFQGLESDLAILVLPITEDQVVLAGEITLPREEHLHRVLYTGMSRAKTMLIIVAHESYKETLELRADLYDKLIVLQ